MVDSLINNGITMIGMPFVSIGLIFINMYLKEG